MSTGNIVFNPDFSDPNYDLKKDFSFETGDRWANNEKQCYRDDARHCFIKDGILNLVATKEEGSCPYVSARITTKEKHHFHKGQCHVRLKAPHGRGSWPAVWFLGLPNPGEIRRWPDCGEIDLMEFAGNRPDVVSCALHTKAFNHKIGNPRGGVVTLPDLSSAFHDFLMIWNDDMISFQVDNILMARFERQAGDTEDQWPFDKPYYLLLNLAVGGWYGGPINDNDFPFIFQIEKITFTSLG